MDCHINLIIPVLILACLAYNVDCGLTEEKLTSFLGSTHHDVDQGTKWAVLVAGSMGYENYRHQADICHAYQILKRGGLKDENIIVFMYDDIAYNEENPRQGIIINNPHGSDVYKGVPKDYTGEHVTTKNLLAAILGDKKALSGGSGKVVNSGPNDHIFIYYADHGSPGVLTMPFGDEDLYAKDFINTLKKKYESGSYKSMAIYVEACEAGSIFDGHGTTPKEWNIYVTTASNPSESSWATYCPGSDQGTPPPKGYDTCLGDLYSVAWMEDCDIKNLDSETLQQQYNLVKRRTLAGEDAGSHVMQYGDISLGRDPLSTYMGINPNHRHHLSFSFRSIMPIPQFDQYEADLIFFKQKVNKAAEGSIEKAKAEKKLNEVISERKHIDSSIEAITKIVFSASHSTANIFQMLKTVRPAGQPLVDDWDCLKSLVGIYKTYCGPLKSYGMQYTRVFANMCNAGVQKDKIIQATSLACGQKTNN